MAAVLKAIDGYKLYDCDYYIHPVGAIYYAKSDGSLHRIAPRKNSAGNMTVKLYKNKGKEHSTLAIHRLVAQHFIPNPENYNFIRHKDGDKHNNSKDNLEWYRSTCIHSPDNKVAV